MDKDILLIRKLLELNERKDLSKFLEFSTSNIYEEYEYQEKFYTYCIYSPLEYNFHLKKITDEDNYLILDTVKQIYPKNPGDHSIDRISFFIRDEDLDDSNLATYDIARFQDKISEHDENKIFISYSNNIIKVAAAFADQLSKIGYKVFLAHRDILPSRKWLDEIINELETSAVFIPLLSDSFKKSDWTDQECGIAFSKGLLVIPVSFTYDPYGFLRVFQSLRVKVNENNKISPESVENGCLKIKNIIEENRKTNEL
jgi:hypothetical protein